MSVVEIVEEYIENYHVQTEDLNEQEIGDVVYAIKQELDDEY